MKKKNTIKYKKFIVDLYRVTVHYIEGPSMKKLVKRLKKETGTKVYGDDFNYHGLMVKLKDRDVAILIETKKDKIFQDSVLAHECDHAATEILNQVGFDIDYQNDEPHAYLIQHLFLKCKR